ncbi:hypothetical protein RR48_06040 [Papilio machaon]|uniref:Peptidase S1 domain-containing protein n=1 Tax=Papilio machaon TaxID=76193 RepID=A0A194RFL1_PAPMA|nr:hypothetical protein RR48_06040 [Papilio machaon]
MSAQLLCALLAVALVRARAHECAPGTGQLARPCQPIITTTSEDADLDEESDSAPFMIVVEHGDGWRCAASLVSLRTGVTSARCARGRAHPAQGRNSEQMPQELWALAAAQLARRVPGDNLEGFGSRPASPASTARRVARIALAGDRRRGEDPLLDDLAVLELESPFGSSARARPILMATSRTECEKETACHAVRAVAGAGAHRARFRVVDAALVAEAHCATRVPHWADVRDRAFCFSGEELCSNDRGTGVVCGGKLCGVLSDSVSQEGRHAADCGDTHVAMSVARWRAFLHCAHTLRACGRGDCESLCSEHRLLNTEPTTDLSTHVDSTPSAAVPPAPHRSSPADELYSYSSDVVMLTSAKPDARFPVRPAHEYEPNRPDFKAGEYGDNAADYEEPVPTTRRRAMSVSRSVPRALHTVTRTHPTPSPSKEPPAEYLLSTTDNLRPHSLFRYLYLLILTNIFYIT